MISGKKLRTDMLQPGGSKDPSALVTDLLGGNSLQHIGGGFAPHVEGLLLHHGILATS